MYHHQTCDVKTMCYIVFISHSLHWHYIKTALHKYVINSVIVHIINSPYNFSIPNCPQSSDRVQLRFQSPERYIIKYLKHTKLYSIELLRTEKTSDPSNCHRKCSSYGSCSLFQSKGSDVIFVLKKSIEYSFVLFKCLLNRKPCRQSA